MIRKELEASTSPSLESPLQSPLPTYPRSPRPPPYRVQSSIATSIPGTQLPTRGVRGPTFTDDVSTHGSIDQTAVAKRVAGNALGGEYYDRIKGSGVESLDTLLQAPTVRFGVAKPTSCPDDCWCQCHNSTYQIPVNFKWKLAGVMRYLSGALFMAYSGNPILKLPCTARPCIERKRSRFQATYTFPSWFIQYSVEVFYQKYGTSRPNMGIRVRNRVNIYEREQKNLMSQVSNGSVDVLLSILRSHPYQMNDITVLNGSPILLEAVRGGNQGIVKVLLAAGADPDEMDDHGISPRMEMTRVALKNKEDIHSGLPGLFDVWGYLQDCFFPTITKSVLGFPGAPRLEEMDERIIPDILDAVNTRDDFGWQALHWAIIRGDIAAGKRLLEMGADPNSDNGTMKRSSLHLIGANNRVAPLTHDLIDSGALPTRDIFARSPIDHACYYGSLDCLEAMLQANMPHLCVERVNASPLYCAVFAGQIEILKYLIDLKDPFYSNLEWRDSDAETAIFGAIYASRPQVLDILLSAGADPSAVCDYGTNALHTAAVHGNADILRVFLNHNLSSLDPHHKTPEGASYRELYSRRTDMTRETDRVFERVAAKVENGGRGEGGLGDADGGEDNDGDNDGDEFYDAVEHSEDG